MTLPGERKGRCADGRGFPRPLAGVSMTQDVTWAWLPAAPHPFQPPHHRDPAQTGRIVQHPGAAAVAGRNHPARRAAGFDLIRLHRYDQPAVTIIFNIEHVPAGNIKDHIGSGAPAQATHRMGHRRVLRGTGAWSPLILKVPTPLLGHQHAQPDTSHHRQFRRPCKLHCDKHRWFISRVNSTR